MKNQKAPSKKMLAKVLKGWESGKLSVRKSEGYSGNAKDLLPNHVVNQQPKS